MQTLAEQLEDYLASLEERADPALMASWASYMRRLLASGVADAAPRAGSPAPDFTLPDCQGRPVSLAGLREHGPVVVFFVRGGWCPFCTLTLRAMARAWPAIHKRGASLIAITPETPRRCTRTVEHSVLPFPVLHDHDNALARRWGLAVELPPEIQEVYRRFGHDIAAANGTTRWELPMPAAFVIGQDGRIVLAHVDPRVERRLEPSAVLAALDSLALAE